MAEEENLERPEEAVEAPKAEEPAEAPAAQEATRGQGEPEPVMPKEQGERDENTVFVGKKGVMGYVLAVVTQFNNGATEVTIKARGKLISRAVDVAEIVRNRFLPGVKVDNIDIMTEELQSEDGSRSKVSAMEIRLKK